MGPVTDKKVPLFNKLSIFLKKSLDLPQYFNTVRDQHSNAGWSSLVARQAHNLKVPGSNPGPAPNLKTLLIRGGFSLSPPLKGDLFDSELKNIRIPS